MSKVPSLRHINHQRHCSFIIKEGAFDLDTSWHYHEELEILFIKKGKVSAIMGNNFMVFEGGDLLLLGSNFPHVIFRNATDQDVSENVPEGIVIQFRSGFLGENFFSIPEMTNVKVLLQKSQNGLFFRHSIRDEVRSQIEKISKKDYSHQLIILLQILLHLADNCKFDFLTSEKHYQHSELDELRMQRVKRYIYSNFKNRITIGEVAEIANMTETSFCRYYKRKTLKSFTRTLNEIRISHACELLQNGHSNVTEACFLSGFNSLAFFSRTFKKIVGVSPSSYKSQDIEHLVRW